MFLKNKQLVFVHIPRTSGTSIEDFLLNGKLVPDGAKHLRASQIYKIVGEQKWSESFKFSIIRNPWDKVISHYHQPFYKSINSLSNKSLDFFLKKYKPAPWEHGFQCSDFVDKELDLIIRFEDRVAGLKRLEQETGVYVDNSVHHKATSQRRTKEYKHYYDEETKNRVAQLYAGDIAAYNYTFE